MGTGPYRTPDGHRLAARVHSHYLGLIAGAVDAEALPLILQQDDLGNTQAAVRERPRDTRPRPGLGSIFNLLGARPGRSSHTKWDRPRPCGVSPSSVNMNGAVIATRTGFVESHLTPEL